MVKFPENPQGELVLANEFLSCQLAELLDLPINRAVVVSIDERLLRLPRQDGRLPPTFSAGLRCGMIRFEKAEGVQPADIPSLCSNSAELHAVGVFEQFVCRNDGRQLLLYPDEPNGGKRFAAYDYGFAFGGQPQWSAATLSAMAAPVLPTTDPFSGQPYQDGTALSPIIEKLRALGNDAITRALMTLHPPRWGITPDDLGALASLLCQRAGILVEQFDKRHKPQLEAL